MGFDKEVDQALMLAKKVAATAKKIDYYEEEDRDPPALLEQELTDSENELDGLVYKLLNSKANLKSALLEHQQLTEESAKELEWSYRKATCFTKTEGQHARMFFLPFLYVQDEAGKKHGLITFKGRRLETLKSFLIEFAAQRSENLRSSDLDIRVYPDVFLDCIIADAEEKYLPKLHEAILKEERIKLVGHFKQHAQLRSTPAGEDNTGWSLGVLAFSLIHADIDALESVDFASFQDEFEEEFEGIFDQGSENDFRTPIEPVRLQDEGTRFLWEKQLQISVLEMLELKNKVQKATIECVFFWDEGGFTDLITNFYCGQVDAKGFYKRIMRHSLINETPSDIVALLAEYEPIMRSDCQVVFHHDSCKNIAAYLDSPDTDQ